MAKAKRKPVRRESASRPHDLSEVLRNAPPGAWVALSADKTQIMGTGSSIKAAAYEAQLRGEDHPVLIRMPLADEGLAAGVR